MNSTHKDEELILPNNTHDIMRGMKVSFLVPVYNEDKAGPTAVRALKIFLDKLGGVEFEIIVVNDGSSDKSAENLAQVSGIRLINHPYNKGYGASLKTAMKAAQYDWVFFFDGDGQPRAEDIPQFFKYTGEYDMIVGHRINSTSPILRQPGKKLLLFLANYMADKHIPDLNSGFRLIRKSDMQRVRHLLPDSFSLTTTIPLAFLKAGLNIKYLPITPNKRMTGNSTVKPRHAVRMFFLILRTITLFSPLRVFMPVVVFLWAVLGLSLVYYIYNVHITNTTVVLFMSSLIIFFFAMIADQISAIRREIKP